MTRLRRKLWYFTKQIQVSTWHTKTISQFLTLGTEEGPGHVQLLTTDHYAALTIQQLLGNNRGKATEQVTLSVNNDNLQNK